MRRLHDLAETSGFYGVALASAACLGLLAGRMHLAGSQAFLFLVQNLALAWIPFLLSAAMLQTRRRWALALIGLVWWVFLPNAPYLLTDLVHLKPRTPVPYWYDTGMLAFFGFTGLVLGARSLEHVQGLVTRAAGARAGWAVVAGAAMSCGLGIYIGRYLRWNSWDLATRPGAVLADLAQRVVDPTLHPRTWGVTLVFGVGVLAMYMALRRPQVPR